MYSFVSRDGTPDCTYHLSKSRSYRMQPTFQTPWPRLSKASADLASLGIAGVLMRPLLFLCGMKLSFGYFCASNEGDPQARYASAAHLLDDGLDDAARLAVKVLLRIIRSRDFRATLRSLPNGEREVKDSWSMLVFGFLDVPGALTPVPKRWLQHGDSETNWIRLSFGMGARSIWDANDFAAQLIRRRVSFRNQTGEDITPAVVEIVNRFSWDPKWVLPEL